MSERWHAIIACDAQITLFLLIGGIFEISSGSQGDRIFLTAGAFIINGRTN
jgi:hypothetical protein